MPSYPSFLMPTDAVKLRFREPYMSEGNNLKSSGIVPYGIYQGFTPNVGADPNVLILNTDGVRNDSVAVCETYIAPPDVANYNLTIRSTDQLQLDFTGHTVFPCWVVLRPAYSIVAHPFSGTTSAQFVTINTLTINDAVATARHHGDIKICKVTSIGPVVYDTTIPTNRDDNGGYLVTQTQMTGANGLFFKNVIAHASVAGVFGTSSYSYVVVPDFDTSPVIFSLIVPGDVLFIVSASVYTAAGNWLNNTDLGIRINGVDYDISYLQENNLGKAVDSSIGGVLNLYMPAGTHTAQVVIERNSVHSPGYLSNIAHGPTRLVVLTKG